MSNLFDFGNLTANFIKVFNTKNRYKTNGMFHRSRVMRTIIQRGMNIRKMKVLMSN